MIPFTKAHACGNDFLIVSEDAVTGHDRAELTRRLCNRNTGIGADGIEYFSWTGPKTGRVHLRNVDGSVAEISGNGTRCVAAWMAESAAAQQGDEMEIVTDAGLRTCRIDGIRSEAGYFAEVTTNMGVPKFMPHTIKMTDGSELIGLEVSVGNPHFVVLVESADFTVADRTWQALGAEICVHRDFPNQTNAEFVRVLSEREIEVRIFERGVGPTTSSGTGTSAAATAALALRRCVSPLTVLAPGGSQVVTWGGPGVDLHLTGPAALIARGEAW